MAAPWPNLSPKPKPSRARRTGLVVVFVWFAIGGLAHFVFADTEMRIVPPWMPWPREAVWISGVLEWSGVVGLLWRLTRRAAGSGLFLLTLAVTPAHVYMLQQPDLFDVPVWLLWLRLPLQVALLALIAWAVIRPCAAATFATPIPPVSAR
ncbi:MAG: hypothetical protein ABIN96_02475 [Rubrivivax sp.]